MSADDDTLAGALDKTALPVPLTVYRGDANYHDEPNRYKLGEEFQPDTFLSTSTDKDEAASYAYGAGGEQAWFLTINLPKGTHAAQVGQFANINWSPDATSDEVIVQRGSRLRVTKVGQNPVSGANEATLDLIPPELTETFDPLEPRDRFGRWTATVAARRSTGMSSPFDDVFAGQHLLTDEERDALHKLSRSSDYANAYLRGEALWTGAARARIPLIDSAMDKQRLKQPMVTYRRIRKGRHEFGGDYSLREQDLVGRSYTSKGYQSTSSYPFGPMWGDMLMELHLPAGLPVASPSVEGIESEMEVLLPRDALVTVTGYDAERDMLVADVTEGKKSPISEAFDPREPRDRFGKWALSPAGAKAWLAEGDAKYRAINYHGSSTGVIATSGLRPGQVWSTEEPALAKAYSQIGGKGQVTQLAVKLKNPLVAPLGKSVGDVLGEQHGKEWKDRYAERGTYRPSNPGYYDPDVYLPKLGYDGVVNTDKTNSGDVTTTVQAFSSDSVRVVRPDGERRVPEPISEAFDPHEPRDKIGRWAKSAGKSSVPAPPGSTPIPAGYVRLFHYTTADPAVIRKEGIRIDKAKGESYMEPNAVWASARMPDPHTHNIAEFAVKAGDPRMDIGAFMPTIHYGLP